MKRILSSTTGHLSYDSIRTLRPLAWPGLRQSLWSAGVHVETRSFNDAGTQALCSIDCVVLHGIASTNVLNLLRKIPCRFAVFQDDLMRLEHIPPWNPAVFTAAQQKCLDWVLEHACAIVTTTEELAERLGYRQKTFVCGNLEDFSGRFPERVPGMRAAVYVGGTSHAGDLELLNDCDWNGPIAIWANCLPSAWTTAYRNKLGVLELRPNRWNRGWIEPVFDYERYQARLRGIAPRFTVGLAPLVDNQFNRCKSCLKFIENTKNGWVSVVSRVKPYEHIPDECCVKVAPGESWREAIEYADTRPQIARNAWDYCVANYSYQNNWQQWCDAYSFIASRS